MGRRRGSRSLLRDEARKLRDVFAHGDEELIDHQVLGVEPLHQALAGCPVGEPVVGEELPVAELAVAEGLGPGANTNGLELTALPIQEEQGAPNVIASNDGPRDHREASVRGEGRFQEIVMAEPRDQSSCWRSEQSFTY